jgi:hypothetical protein
MPYTTLGRIIESLSEGPERKFLFEAVVQHPQAPGPMDSMPVELPDNASPEQSIREGLLASAAALLARADVKTIKAVIMTLGLPDSISELVGRLQTPQAGAIATGTIPAPAVVGPMTPAPEPTEAAAEPTGPPVNQQLEEEVAPATEEGSEEVSPEVASGGDGVVEEVEEVPLEGPPDEEEEEGKKKKKKPPVSESAAPLDANVILECVGILAAEGIRFTGPQSRVVIESMARLGTSEQRRNYAVTLKAAIVESAAPPPLVPRSAPLQPRRPAQKEEALDKTIERYSKPGAFESACRQGPLTAGN